VQPIDDVRGRLAEVLRVPRVLQAQNHGGPRDIATSARPGILTTFTATRCQRDRRTPSAHNPAAATSTSSRSCRHVMRKRWSTEPQRHAPGQRRVAAANSACTGRIAQRDVGRAAHLRQTVCGTRGSMRSPCSRFRSPLSPSRQRGCRAGTPRLAALLLPQMSPAFSVVTPLPAGRLPALGATTNFQDAN
jgi:hypothetical protein